MSGSPLWVVPFGFGMILFSFGVLVFAVEELLRYLVAATFCAIGLGIMGMGWRLRHATQIGSPRGGRFVRFSVDQDQEPPPPQ